MPEIKRFETLRDFYPYYLLEHQHPVCRLLHFIGTFLLFVILAFAWIQGQWAILWAIPLVGYGFAWAGHYFFEKNKPATFQYPFFSLASDFILFKDLLVGNEKFHPEK